MENVYTNKTVAFLFLIMLLVRETEVLTNLSPFIWKEKDSIWKVCVGW